MTQTVPTRRSWWRTNAWALVALPLLCLGVLGAVAAETDLHTFFNAESPPPDVVVPVGETFEIGGVTFGPVTFKVSDGLVDGETPPNTQIALAAMPVSGDLSKVGCRNLAVTSLSSRATWQEATRDLRLDLPDDVETSCMTSSTEFTLAGFVVLADWAEGPWAVQLTVEHLGDSIVTELVQFDVGDHVE